MAPHSSTLAWKIPWTGEPGGLPSLGSHRVRHDWSDLLHIYVAETIFISSTDLEGPLWSFLGLNTLIKYLICSTSWAQKWGKTIGKEDTASALGALAMCSVKGPKIAILKNVPWFYLLAKMLVTFCCWQFQTYESERVGCWFHPAQQ